MCFLPLFGCGGNRGISDVGTGGQKDKQEAYRSLSDVDKECVTYTQNGTNVRRRDGGNTE